LKPLFFVGDHSFAKQLPYRKSRDSAGTDPFTAGGRSTDAEAATKWVIEGLTSALAQELPPGLATVPFNPGIINTAMLQSCFAGGTSQYPMRRNGPKPPFRSC
jgi:NAD(P)-dependent dehydrogenase (short-subunit alcohol dehydrogenase family)